MMCFVKEAFPLFMFVPSVHQMLAHNLKLFQPTGGKSISLYSEQASETWNKSICSYKSDVGREARQLTIKLNMLDFFISIHPINDDKKHLVSCSHVTYPDTS